MRSLNYRSQFSPEDTELYLQYLERLQMFLSPEALVLMEELDQTEDEQSGILLRVKEGDRVFKVESFAPSTAVAVLQACEKVVELILSKEEKTLTAPKITSVSLFH